ncbi:toll/interleukin-1 receptor domain-containing protein [Spirosoma areae]
MAKTLWITYSWEDNKSQEVEYIAQEIESKGIVVKIDRWNINAGKRLWEQIDKFIIDPIESDAWAIYATNNSLSSERCKEEIAYALNRALGSRGANFPLIGIFPYQIDQALIPSAIKTRLYVSIEDEHWLERIVSAVKGTPLTIIRERLLPFTVELVPLNGNSFYSGYIKIAPRVAIWTKFYIGVPIEEKEKAQISLCPGTKQGPPLNVYEAECNSSLSKDKLWWVESMYYNANSNTAYCCYYKELPSKVVFNMNGTQEATLDMMDFAKTGQIRI